MHPEAMIATLKSLKLFGMANAIDDLAQQSSLRIPAKPITHSS
jgi:hypothetical protein